MDNNKAFLGQGMKFPPQVNPATGRFMTVSKEQSVKESVYVILMTQKQERLMRPNFGTSLMSYTFMDTGVTALNMMSRELSTDIMRQEPRIADVQVDIDSKSKEGCLFININYRVRESNVKDNLVFPFYLDATWEEKENEHEFGEIVETV